MGFAASHWACGLARVGSKFRCCGAPPAGRTPRRLRRGLGRLRGRAGRSRAGRGGDPGRLLQLPAARLAALQPPPPAPSAPRAPRPARPRRGHTLSSPRPPGPALCGARGRARPLYLWLRVALGSEVGAVRGAGRSESLQGRSGQGLDPRGFGWAFVVRGGDEGWSSPRHFCEGSSFCGWKAAMLVYCNAGGLLLAPSCSPWCQEAALAPLAFPETRGAACGSPQAGGCPALPAGPSCAAESLQPS